MALVSIFAGEEFEPCCFKASVAPIAPNNAAPKLVRFNLTEKITIYYNVEVSFFRRASDALKSAL